MKNLAYSGGYLDRASYRRSDPGWVAALLDSPGTRLIPVWRDHCLVSGDPPAPVTALDAGRSQPAARLPVSASGTRRPDCDGGDTRPMPGAAG